MRKLLIIPLMFLLILSVASATNLTYVDDYRVYEYNFYDQYASKVKGLDYSSYLDGYSIVADYQHGSNRGYISNGVSGTSFQTNAYHGLTVKKMSNMDTSDWYYFYINRLIINENDELAYYFSDGTYREKCNWGVGAGTYQDITIAEEQGKTYTYIYDSELNLIYKATINVSTCSVPVSETFSIPSEIEGIDFAINNQTFYILTSSNQIYQVDTNGIIQDILTHTYLENATSITTDGILLYVGLDQPTATSNQHLVVSFVKPIEEPVIDLPFIYLKGEYWSTINCVGDDRNVQLCNNTQYVETQEGVEMWCDFDDLIDCEAECETKTMDYEGYAVNTGFCGFSYCNNDCSFNGYTECLNSQTMQTCGNYDDDQCLEFSPPTACLDNQICGGYGACLDINYTEYGVTTSYPDFFVNTLIEDDINIKYNYLSANSLHINTNYLLHTQDYSAVTNPPDLDLFGNIDCDYHETVYINHNFATDNELPSFINGTNLNIETSQNTGLDVLKISTDATFQSDIVAGLLVVDLDLIQKDFNKNSELTIVYGGSTYNYLTLIIVHDKDENTFTYYKNVLSPTNLLFTTDVYAGSDKVTSLKYMEIITTFNINDGLVDVYVVASFDDGVTIYEQKVQMTPFNTQSIQANYLDRITIIENEDWYMSHFKIYKPHSLPNIVAPQYLDEALTCTYTDLGCYNVRVYGVGNDLPLYNNYLDKEICINSLGKSEGDIIKTETKSGSIDDLLNKLNEMSLIGQIVMMLIIVGLTSFLFFAVGEEDNIKKSIGIGLVALEIILFIFLGMIPFWILLLVVIVVAMFMTKILRNVFFNGG